MPTLPQKGLLRRWPPANELLCFDNCPLPRVLTPPPLSPEGEGNPQAGGGRKSGCIRYPEFRGACAERSEVLHSGLPTFRASVALC